MPATLARLAGRRGRCALLAALAAGATGAFAAPARATPTWGITMTHANAYGLEAGLCPGKQTHTEPPCGIDPLTEGEGDEAVGGEGKTFARESGHNRYTITVEGSEGAGSGNRTVGETLTCAAELGENEVDKYRWLRNGEQIKIKAGEPATSSKYQLAAADAGKVIQCEVIAKNKAATTATVSHGALAEPPSEPPTLESSVTTTPPGGAFRPVGTTVTCHPGAWTGSPSFEYQWLSGGEPISGATLVTHTLTEKDIDTAVQCEVIARNAHGASVAVSRAELAVWTDNGAGDIPKLPHPEVGIAVVTVVDPLPKGMLLGGHIQEGSQSPSTPPFPPEIEELLAPGWFCSIAPGAGGVECSNVKKPPYAPIKLNVFVGPSAENPSMNVASVSGVGAPSANTGEKGKTTVTNAVPFGIFSYAVNPFEEPANPLAEPLKEPFSGEAGGHPFAVATELALNPTISEAGIPVPAGGAAKGIQAEVPPGFVGDPQNAPQCAIELLKEGTACPEDTAVGYTEVVLENARLEKGEVATFQQPEDVPVYNMQPAPGHPAEFGFLALKGTPFLLEASVRSDGDYGVTLGDSAAANGPKLIGDRVVFCENGAVVTNAALGQPAEGHCKSARKAPPGQLEVKPFLTYPTACSSSPLAWGLRVNPWEEPGKEVSKAAQTIAPNSCKELEYHPELEFKPSPPEFKPSSPAVNVGGTALADEPTGMTSSVRVPQTNEAHVPATPDLRDLTMTLPAGMTVSPSAGDGLQACSNAQFGLGKEWGTAEVPLPPGVKPTEPANEASCPLASQIGTVEVFTPLLSGAPAIEGVPEAGEELKCSEGMWSRGPWNANNRKELEEEGLSFSYQWLRDGEETWLREGKKFKGPSGTVFPGEYRPVAEDAAHAIQCQVKATNAYGSSVAVSRAVVIEPEPSTRPPVPPPSISAPSGTAAVDHALTCSGDLPAWTVPLSSDVVPTLTYRWLRGGVPIQEEFTAGQEEGPLTSTAKYPLTPADEGKVIQCQVRGSDAGGTTIADSAAVIVSPAPSSTPPLPGAALQGQLFAAQPECSPCTEGNKDAKAGRIFRLFLQAQDRTAGVIVKAYGKTSAEETTGQLTTTFKEQPQQPFELLNVKLKGGPRATLANPQTCGPAVTKAELTPWSGPETEPVQRESSYNVEGCSPSPSFNPSFNAGTTGPTALSAGAYTAFSLTIGREDREQDLSGVTVSMPPGLVGKIAGIPRCGEAEVHEAEASTGECPAASEIGTATALAGPGPDPFKNVGHVYLTGPTTLKSGLHGPFGLAVVTPAVAGPFNLGNVVVRSAIDIDPHTAAVTVTSDPLPQFHDGVQLRLRKVNVTVNRSQFMLNPTNCSAQQVTGTLTSAPNNVAAQVASPFGVSGCTRLPFKPTFTASTQAHTSKEGGASLDVKITYPPGEYANIAKSVTELPKALPSRLTTIQKSCVDTVFEANPAACKEGSVVGYATAQTPILEKPLTGPAYLVSHGNRAFPDIEVVLQGEGITLVLDGQTDIKNGITKTSFEAVPDSPVSTFELVLPESPHSALASNVNTCTTPLSLPTILTAQNGAVMKQNTPITVTGCPPTVAVTKAKVAGNALLVTVKLSAAGTVRIAGKGLKATTRRNLKAGTHQIRVPLTRVGRSMRRHRGKVNVHVSLKVGKQAAFTKSAVRL